MAKTRKQLPLIQIDDLEPEIEVYVRYQDGTEFPSFVGLYCCYERVGKFTGKSHCLVFLVPFVGHKEIETFRLMDLRLVAHAPRPVVVDSELEE